MILFFSSCLTNGKKIGPIDKKNDNQYRYQLLHWYNHSFDYKIHHYLESIESKKKKKILSKKKIIKKHVVKFEKYVSGLIEREGLKGREKGHCFVEKMRMTDNIIAASWMRCEERCIYSLQSQLWPKSSINDRSLFYLLVLN